MQIRSSTFGRIRAALTMACVAGVSWMIGGSTAAGPAARAARPVDFVKDVQPILRARCYDCHGEKKQKGELRLDVKAVALKGGESGPAIVPGASGKSHLIRLVSGVDPDAVMPPKGDRLTAEQIGILRAWIDQGAIWPDDASKTYKDPRDHWAYQPLTRPAVPALAGVDAKWARNPIDAFVLTTLKEKGLRPSPEADKRMLLRRVTFDLTGLPPTLEEIEAFEQDSSADAYEKVVDRLLASPRYGERWARHWLDAVHYGDTHGYDKDKVRPNAWPYRDYVIRSFNEDKNYSRFVKEQLAGDYFYKGTPDGIIALGFIAAGPWDFVGQVELREGTLDKQITRNLDRDDMVSVTMNTFVSSTAQCARCHNHKFDPISQEDYYSLQAVFAGVDRADRPYDLDPVLAEKRTRLENRRDELIAQQKQAEAVAKQKAGAELEALDKKIEQATKATPSGARPEFGYHSKIEPSADVAKWVQIDLGKSLPIDRIVIVGAHDTYAGIGAGFGFPLRYKVEISDDLSFKSGVMMVEDRTAADAKNPRVTPQTITVGGKSGRYVRLTATKLAERTKDYILAIGEMMVLAEDGSNLAAGAAVTAADSIEAPPRWRKSNLVDGYYYGVGANSRDNDAATVAGLRQQRRDLIVRCVPAEIGQAVRKADEELDIIRTDLKAFPESKARVYAAVSVSRSSGGLLPAGGKARPIYLLKRGSEKNPDKEVGPGTIHAIGAIPSRFDLPAGHDEAERRAALANWIVDERNPLTWRSIVNRVWQHHFGKGIVDTPNDFGRMGGTPTHPQLLDYLAIQFRDGGDAMPTAQSIKSLHRLIVTSSTYRQSPAGNAEMAKIDGNNQFLWRMNRTKLDAECLRDSMLQAAGKLDLAMGGPGFRVFGFKDDHSPHYKYNEYDLDDKTTWRRSVYRFVVRSVPDPLMETLDCADPSQIVPKRNETLTALQALSLMNNTFTLKMAEHLAERATPLGKTDAERVVAAFRIAIGRSPNEKERAVLSEVAMRQGLPSACRLIFNLNEFAFVD